MFQYRKDFIQFVNWLQKKVVVKQVDLSTFSASFVEHLVCNAINSITNLEIRANRDELDFICYRLENVAHNEAYNDVLKITHERFVYVIFEKKTGYILSNSGKLQLESVIAWGVTQKDKDTNSIYMKYYIDCCNAYNDRYMQGDSQ